MSLPPVHYNVVGFLLNYSSRLCNIYRQPILWHTVRAGTTEEQVLSGERWCLFPLLRVTSLPRQYYLFSIRASRSLRWWSAPTNRCAVGTGSDLYAWSLFWRQGKVIFKASSLKKKCTDWEMGHGQQPKTLTDNGTGLAPQLIYLMHQHGCCAVVCDFNVAILELFKANSSCIMNLLFGGVVVSVV